MARQAIAVQARPMTLVALTEQIQAAVECHGWTVWVAREGDSLVVDLIGTVCPDPLLAMMIVEVELGQFDTAGLEAVKLYGHRSMAGADPGLGTAALESPGWMSVIDLGQYFARRAALSPEAFGLPGAEASRMACEAERDRYSSGFAATSPEAEPADPRGEMASQPPAPLATKQAKVSTQALAPLTGYDLYREFIAEQSSWFAQTVKDNPRLHDLAKQRQHYTISTLSHYLVETLADNERLMDLLPVRKRDRGCGLIFTDQRVIALSCPSRSDRQGLQVWMLPWSWVHKVELFPNALRFHYGRAREYFRVDLETPYHLRNSIPRDIPVRMVRESGSPQPRVLETKVGLAMVAGVMFALGSGFSLLNHGVNRQLIEARSNPLVASRSAIQGDLPSQPLGDVAGKNAPNASADSVVEPLAMTTNPGECVDSFNHVAEPHAYATLNQVTHTFQVNFQNQVLLNMSPQQFNQTAAVVAEEILVSCQTQAIRQVVVSNGAMRYQQQRSASHGSPVAPATQS